MEENEWILTVFGVTFHVDLYWILALLYFTCVYDSPLWLLIGPTDGQIRLHLTLAHSIDPFIVTCVWPPDISLAFVHKVKVKQLLLIHLKVRDKHHIMPLLTIPTEITLSDIFLQFAPEQRSPPAGKGSWNNYKIITIAFPSTWEKTFQLAIVCRDCVALQPLNIPPFPRFFLHFDSSGFCWQYQQRLACLIFWYNRVWHNQLRGKVCVIIAG